MEKKKAGIGMKSPYEKGCVMTFDTEATEVPEREDQWDYQYLLPRETSRLREDVIEACDRMEYAGSPMYDQYPDRVTIDRITDHICGDRRDDPMLHALVQVLLCGEMGCRRDGCKRNRPRPPHSHRPR